MTDIELRKLKKRFNKDIDKVIRKDLKLEKELIKLKKNQKKKRRDN